MITSQIVTAPKPNVAIATKAADATDGDNVIYNSTEAHVVDTVTYTAITPGVEYTLKGTLIDKSTGKPVLAGDKPVEGKATFTPSAANGEAQVDFIFDASKIEGKELVCFEYLYRDMEIDGTAEPVLVAQHTDASDRDQTVSVTAAAPGEAYPKTGVLDDPWQALAIALGAVALTAAGCILWQRRKLHN